MNTKELLQFCNEYLSYNPISGEFTWLKKVHKSSNAILGARVGYIHYKGYRYIKIKRKNHAEHRLAFLITNGHLPEFIDHINGIKDDNRITNLRSCTRSQNGMNRGLQSNSSSGFCGVSFNKSSNKYQAYIKIDNRKKSLGYYHSKEDGARAYNKAAIKYFGEFAVLNKL